MVNRLVSIAGVLFALAGAYSFPKDARDAGTDAVNAVSDNPVGAALVVMGLVLLAIAHRDRVLLWLGFGWTNQHWVDQLNEWMHKNRKMAIKATEVSWRNGFRVAYVETAMLADGKGTHERTYQFFRLPKADTVVIAMGIEPNAVDAARLAQASPTYNSDVRAEIMRGILSTGAQYEVSAVPETLAVSKVTVLNEIPAKGGLTELEFAAAYGKVLQAREMANVLIGVGARHAVPSSTETPAVASSVDAQPEISGETDS